jgi:hypothetical protein
MMGGTRDDMAPRPHPGWYGLFTRHQMPGAIRNGTRVVKVRTEAGDTHPVGSLATVLGSMGHPDVGIGYFVEWDARPRFAVLVVADKIAPAADRA